MKDDDARDCNVIDTPGFMYSHLLVDCMTVQFCDTHTSQLSFRLSHLCCVCFSGGLDNKGSKVLLYFPNMTRGSSLLEFVIILSTSS